MKTDENGSVVGDSDKQDDGLEDAPITVLDRGGRRSFIRRGAAFIGAGTVGLGALSAPAGKAYADDCDRNTGEKNENTPGSDADAGAGADAPGCGRQPTPKISQNGQQQQIKSRVSVAKVKV